MSPKPKGPRAELISLAKKARASRKRRIEKVGKERKGQRHVRDHVRGGSDNGEGRTLANDQTRLELLAELRINPVISRACNKLGVKYTEYVHNRKMDQQFAEAVDEARVEGWERLESATFEEAMRPSEPGVNTSKLKEFLLKGRKRHAYGDRLDVQAEHRHEVVVNLVPALPGALAPPLPASGEVVEGQLIPEIDSGPVSEEE